MLRTQLYADPNWRFVHDVVFESCRRNGGKTALIDTSCNRRFTFGESCTLVAAPSNPLPPACSPRRPPPQKSLRSPSITLGNSTRLPYSAKVKRRLQEVSI